MGLILAGANASAMDVVAAHLLGYDPAQLPIVREGFAAFRWPITSFGREAVSLTGDWGSGAAEAVLSSRCPRVPVVHPFGWRSTAAHPTRAEALVAHSIAHSQ
jgi:uncharacterized protein (DUF362 family)